ncbi:MAG TPA: hypothetical protein K8V32_12015 [Enteractinococcus helveticum]|uniref:Uncharacterized protein n=1 Tax=Enteractinococcus helveticum TaxID=1837282 RepID=A0A921FNR9_9MICC|nr:hypothetical protein [Enteractinococcus helveticum]HJF15499.1 hypothetical protein [Enteractinococcus helveticum]
MLLSLLLTGFWLSHTDRELVEIEPDFGGLTVNVFYTGGAVILVGVAVLGLIYWMRNRNL